MKIAIITYHRALNYGSALQAYALNHYFWKQGSEAYTIDYSSEGQQATYSFYEKGHSIMTLARNFFTFIYRKALRTKRNRFNSFIKNKIPLIGTEIFDDEDTQKTFDAFVCGSDQIWNGNTIDFTPHYLLDFVKEDRKCFSYAPSIGTLQQRKGTEEAYKRYLTKFPYISVRESSGSKYLSKIIGREVETVLDPVFLLDGKEWRKVANSECSIKGDYVLCYFIGDVKGMRDFALQLGKFYHCKVYVILFNLRDMLSLSIKTLYSAGPTEFVNLIDKAKCICTNSFHAMSFSIILNKNFWVFVNNKNAASTEVLPQTRILDLAENVGLSERVLDPYTFNNVNLGQSIQYQNVYEKLNSLKISSKNYLKKVISYGKSI